MKKIDRILLYKIIAGASFVLLCLTQLLHIRNMYNLENSRYNNEEKKRIKVDYEKSIANDKLFPGGQKYIDSIVYGNYDRLRQLWQTDRPAYHTLAATIRDSLFCQLRAANNLDSLLPLIRKRANVSANVRYALLLQSLEIAFGPSRYAPFYDRNADSAIGLPSHKGMGVLLGGNLEDIKPENQVSGLIVSSPTAPSYRIAFALHAESPDRLKQITRRLLPTILVSVVSIVAMLLISLFTLINWQRQRKASEMKSDFINTITHEFQTPLTAILIANKSIENENNSLNNLRILSLNNVIKRQAERMNVLIKQVVESNSEQGMTLHPEAHHVNEVLEEILADYEVNVQDKAVQLHFDKGTEKDKAMLDKLYFTSVVLNILDNAVKYNHKPRKEIRITTNAAGDKTLQLSIRDNGEGMSEKVRKNIFTRFYRDPSLTRSNEPGLGLGLYFAQQSLTAHGWKYEVKSKEGQGTEFLIWIPLHA